MYTKALIIIFVLSAVICLPCRPSHAYDRITSFSYSAGGMCNYSCWSMTVTDREDKILLSVRMTDEKGEADFECPSDGSLLTELEKIADKHKIVNWDGFNKSSKFALDGNSFGLAVIYASGKTVNARGYVLFPREYRQFANDLMEIRDKAVKKYREQ